MADLSKIVDELSKLTVLEAADLAKMLEEKWGVTAAAAVAGAAGPAGAGAAAAQEKNQVTGLLPAARGKKIQGHQEGRAPTGPRVEEGQDPGQTAPHAG